MRFIYTLCAVIVVTAPAAMGQVTSIAFPQVYGSGAIGLTATDAARWNVVNPPFPAPIVAPTCAVTLSFHNGSGQLIKREAVTLRAGESRSLVLNVGDFPSTGNPTGLYALATVPVTGPVDQPTPGGTCTLVTTLEIFDTGTGKTAAVTKGDLVRPSGLQPAQPVPLGSANGTR